MERCGYARKQRRALFLRAGPRSTITLKTTTITRTRDIESAGTLARGTVYLRDSLTLPGTKSYPADLKHTTYKLYKYLEVFQQMYVNRKERQQQKDASNCEG